MMKKISDKLLAYLKNVPKGKVTTYQQLAERFRTHPRAVGSILKSNPTPIVVPCHRVVCSDGAIGGYKLGIQKKIELLKKEGVKIKERKIALEIYKWKAEEKMQRINENLADFRFAGKASNFALQAKPATEKGKK